MSTTVEILRDILELNVDCPFEIAIDGAKHRLQYRLSDSSGALGTVVDKEWAKLAPIADALKALGYGHACIDLDDVDFEEFSEMLDEWGIAHG